MNPIRARIASAVVCFFVLALPAMAKDPVGKPGGGGTSIEWRVDVRGHDRIQLTVLTPDGDMYRNEFNAGKDPSFRLSDLSEVTDGVYSYELRVIPKVSVEVQKKLENARASNDEKAAKKIRKDAGLLDSIVQSGGFTVLNGSILSPEAIEGTGAAATAPATKATTGGFAGVTSDGKSFTPIVNDQVIPDDLIVQGSACVGIDCVNNESFGFDTIRMKENNLRIKAEDTSSSTGFPTSDWQLTFNDSASGGLAKFSVDETSAGLTPFTVEGSTPTNSLYVDNTGNVGVGTSTPVLDVSVTTSNTPALRLEQNSSGGFTAQTWDIGANEANFFVRDLTGGSKLSFRIRPGAPTSSIDIAADGDVGIATGSPAERLHVAGGHIMVENTYHLRSKNMAGTAVNMVGMNNDDLRVYAGKMAITQAGSVGIGTLTPSSRLHVDGGDIRVSGGSFIDDGTTLNVPDYVFEPSYPLMPIEQLASHIREKKHLPNIPSAAEVKTGGLNLSQMQMRLLEKVEELTLYTVDQHEQIAALKQQNEQLQKRLQQIEALLGSKEQ